MSNHIEWILKGVVVFGVAGLTACGGSWEPDFEKTEAQQALTPAAEEAGQTVRIARDSEGTVIEARDGDASARVEIGATGQNLTAVRESRERVELLVHEAASAGYCRCDSNDRVEVNASSGDDTAQVIVDGCNVYVDAQSGEDSATVSVRDDALACDGILEVAYAAEALALAADDVGDALTELTAACDDMDAAGAEAGLVGDNCDPTGGIAPGYAGAGIQEACDAFADAQQQCQEAEDTVAAWYVALSDSSESLDLTLTSLDDDVGILIQADDDEGNSASVWLSNDA